MAAPLHRCRTTPVQGPGPVRREIIDSRGGAGWTVLALALGCASALATLVFLQPGPPDGHRPTDGIRSLVVLSDDPATIAVPVPESDAPRRLRTEADDIVTGSVGPAAALPPAAGASIPAAFGADLGPAATIAGLRQEWAGAKLLLGGEAALLRPLIAVRETTGGHELHLVIGPLADAADAAGLCARLGRSRTGCAPAAFDGQRLTIP